MRAMKLTRPDAWNLTTPPAAEPISLAQAKEHLRVDDTNSDDYITLLIVAAREYFEQISARSLIDQTWKAYFDRWPWGFELPQASPLSSVTSIKYTDTDGDETTLSSLVYSVDTKSLVGNIQLAHWQSWPSASLAPVNPIVIEYVAGYDGTGTLTPQAIKQALLLHIGHMFENREEVIVGTITSEVPFAYDTLVAPYRVRTF